MDEMFGSLPWDTFFWVFGVFAFGFIIGRARGFGQGQTRERERCLSLCRQAWQHYGVVSATVRRVAHSIDGGHDRLISVDDFFYERPDVGYRDSARKAKEDA